MSEFQETIIGDLPADWTVGLFSEDLKIQGRIGWKGYTKSDLVESGPIVIGGTEIKSSIHLNLENVKHLSRFKYEESPEIMLKDGDVLLVTRGNLGEVGYYHSEYGEGTINPSVIILKEFEGYSKYLFYYLISRNGNHQVLSLTSGSSIPAIYQSEVYQLYYPKPRIEEQKAIANILTAFDDKIENLQAQNKTLEQTAQTIFKEWFGKYQVGDELPEGWRVGKLGDFNATIVDFVANGSFASLKENVTLYEEPEYALFVRNTDLKSNFKEKKYVDRKSYEFLSKSKLYGGEIIISNVGDVGSVHFCPHFDIPMTLGNNVIMLKSDFQAFFYTFFNSIIGQHLISTITGGSAQPKFNKTDFRNMGMVIPQEGVLNRFEGIASDFYKKVFQNNNQIQTLKKTRDTLLPKLMSGRLRVNDLKEKS